MSMLSHILRELIASMRNRTLSLKEMGFAEDRKNVLHVGCGAYHPQKLPCSDFPETEWNEVRLDIDPVVQPDVVASITAMPMIPDESCDAIFSSHNIEHLFAYEVPTALDEFLRVLKPGGFALILVPDIQTVAEWVARDRLDETAYISPAGPITPLDMMYGLGTALAHGNHFMAHRSAFTASFLRRRLMNGGFVEVDVLRIPERFELRAVARKR